MSEVVLASQVKTSTVVWYGIEFETYNIVLKLSNLGSTPYGYRVVQYQNGIQVDIITVAPQTHAINSTTEVDLGTVTGRIGIYLNNDFGETVTIAVAVADTTTAGSQLPCYETIAARDAAYPAPMLGQKIGMRRLCGNGYFEQMYNGSRWESFGSIIKDAGVGYGGYGLTATGVVYVQLVAYVIPADLFGNGETWELTQVVINGATAGSNNYVGRLGGKTIIGGGLTSNQYGVFCTRQSRRNAIVDRTTSGVTYAGGGVQESIDLSSAQTIEAGVIPFAIGDISRILSWTYRRVG